MTETNHPAENTTAEYIAYEEFRDGLPRGRFKVIVNPDLARRFVLYRLHATPIALAIVGPGIAIALLGYTGVGALLVCAGVLFRWAVKREAAKFLLHLTARTPAAYYEATTHGVMEVRRIEAAAFD